MHSIRERFVLVLRNRLGIPGLLAIGALVFAMVGGAWAAAGLNAKQKKEVTKIAKKYAKKYAGKQGPQGVAGPAGPVGPTGAGGPAGPPGQNGTNGKDGVSVTTATASAAECPAGGTKFTSASGTGKLCNGSPWTAGGTLPKGSTETGDWAVNGTNADSSGIYTAIEFNVPLAAPLAAANVHEEKEASFATTCTGSVANPTAPSGHLCVYGTNGIQNLATGGPFIPIPIIDPGTFLTTFEGGAGISGAVLAFTGSAAGPGFGFGSWAVTG